MHLNTQMLARKSTLCVGYDFNLNPLFTEGDNTNYLTGWSALHFQQKRNLTT